MDLESRGCTINEVKKGADQLRSYCAADLRLCFRNAKIRFSNNEPHMILFSINKFQ